MAKPLQFTLIRVVCANNESVFFYAPIVINGIEGRQANRLEQLKGIIQSAYIITKADVDKLVVLYDRTQYVFAKVTTPVSANNVRNYFSSAN